MKNNFNFAKKAEEMFKANIEKDILAEKLFVEKEDLLILTDLVIQKLEGKK